MIFVTFLLSIHDILRMKYALKFYLISDKSFKMLLRYFRWTKDSGTNFLYHCIIAQFR